VKLEKLESHERMAVNMLLDSRATDLFVDTAFAKEKRFKMEMDICNLGKTEVILGMP